jgi:hypothetical protein
MSLHGSSIWIRRDVLGPGDCGIKSAPTRQAAFITAPSMTMPAVTYFQSATSSLRASATMVERNPQASRGARRDPHHSAQSQSQVEELLLAVPLSSAQRHRAHVLPLEDFRRVATRYDRNAPNFLAAVCIAATVSYWL